MSDQDDPAVPGDRPGDHDLTHRRPSGPSGPGSGAGYQANASASGQTPSLPAGVAAAGAPGGTAVPGPASPAGDTADADVTAPQPAPGATGQPLFPMPPGAPAATTQPDAGTRQGTAGASPQAAPSPQPGSPIARLMPPAPAIERSRIAEQFTSQGSAAPGSNQPPATQAHPPASTVAPAAAPTAQPAPTRPRPVSPQQPTQLHSPASVGQVTPQPDAEPGAGSQQGPGPGAATAPLPPEAYAPESIGGLGDAPESPILTLPPLVEEVAGYPLSQRTGEPVRNPVVVASMLSFGAAALVATATYWWYWWVAIHITAFHQSAWLIGWLAPRPGSAASIVLVCVMAVIGALMTAGPGVAGYNVWHGASFSRVAGLVACGTSLLAVFVHPLAWLTLLFAAIGTGLLWLPPARAFLSAWDAYANPPRPQIRPYENVSYGPAPRYR